MGFESDQEIVQMVGTEDQILTHMAHCIEEGHKAQAFTQKQVGTLKNIYIKYSGFVQQGPYCRGKMAKEKSLSGKTQGKLYAQD